MSPPAKTSAEQAMLERFSHRYSLSDCELLHDLQCSACGCAYSATSWSTVEEAQTMQQMLALGKGKRLLEVGAGAGWPGLYLARETNCDIALLDLPLSGLHAINRRAGENAPGRCWAIAGDGAALPFADGRFDAIVHSDVLCCLVRKQDVLSACRRVVHSRGSMVFSVILIPAGLDDEAYQQASATGPPFIESDSSYPELLQRSGWLIREHRDLTAQYQQSLQARIALEAQHRSELLKLFGELETVDLIARRQNTLLALEQGLIRRELFHAEPGPSPVL